MHRIELTKEYLLQEYIIKGQTLQEIGLITGWSIPQVCKKLKEYSLSKQSIDGYKYKHHKFPLTKEELYNLYYTEKFSTYDIANTLNLNPSTIQDRIKKWNIPKPTKREVHVGQKFNKLEVIYVPEKYQSKDYIICVCMCGKEKSVRIDRLFYGSNVSCGCEALRKKKDNNARWKGYKDIYGGYWGAVQFSAKRRKISFDITMEYAWNIFEKQEKRCIFTGVVLRMPRVLNDKNTNIASLDRIDSNKGYIVDNIQWVRQDINKMKLTYNNEEFIKICKDIVEYRKF